MGQFVSTAGSIKSRMIYRAVFFRDDTIEDHTTTHGSRKPY